MFWRQTIGDFGFDKNWATAILRNEMLFDVYSHIKRTNVNPMQSYCSFLPCATFLLVNAMKRV